MGLWHEPERPLLKLPTDFCNDALGENLSATSISNAPARQCSGTKHLVPEILALKRQSGDPIRSVGGLKLVKDMIKFGLSDLRPIFNPLPGRLYFC